LGTGPQHLVHSQAYAPQGRHTLRERGALIVGSVAQMAHPTHEHYLLPLLYAAGAARSADMSRFFNMGYQGAEISMQSIVWG